MRSRKVSPGLTVMRTTIQSERTRVPPVTDERSPPDSRTTGADSPVIADSFTVAAPSITSPSAGDEIARLAPARRRPCAESMPGTSGPASRLRRGFSSFFAIDLVLGAAQRGGLRLAAAFGHALGEVREHAR